MCFMNKILLGFMLLISVALFAQQSELLLVGTGGAPAAGGTTFTKVQIVSGASFCLASTLTCALTVSSTCSGCVGVLMADNPSPYLISSVSGAGTWVVPAGCRNNYAGANTAVSCAYNLSETSGVTTIIVTWNGDTAGKPGLFYLEYSWTGATPALDTTGAATQAGGTTPLPGVALTLSGSKDIIVQAQGYTVPTSITGGSPAYGNFLTDAAAANILSIADSENTASGVAPNWNYSSNSYANTNAIAIK
jgi:hypothetical protein